MKRLTINIGSHGVETTVSEMRKRLARVLSKLNGDQTVFFNFTAHLENYQPQQITPTQARQVIAELREEDHSGLTPPALYSEPAGIPIFDAVIFGELARPEND